MNIWDGEPHRLIPGEDFLPLTAVGDIEPVSEAEGDARLTVSELGGVELKVAHVNNGFNSFATRLQRLGDALGVTVRCWYETEKGGVEYKSYRLSPDNITQYWVQVTGELDEEILDVLA